MIIVHLKIKEVARLNQLIATEKYNYNRSVDKEREGLILGGRYCY